MEQKGLTTDEVKSSFQKHGKNVLTSQKKLSLFKLFIVQYANFITLILFLAGCFSLFVREYVDAGFIVFVIIANGLFSFIQEYRAEKTLEKLKNLVVSTIKVLRDGVEVQIDTTDIVVGDICLIEEGNKIPADGKLLSHLPLEVDESLFTGESLPVAKKAGDKIFSGTFVVQGRGRFVVEAIGNGTRLGEIAKELSKAEKPHTPLSENIEAVGKKLSFLALVFSSILIPIGVLQGRDIKQLILTVVSLAVAVIPEGLPLVVTIALAIGAYRMSQQKSIIRKMASIETLGATTVILSDKTGTLTQNNMSVKKYFVEKKEHLKFLLRCAILGNTAMIALSEDSDGIEVIGNKTDGALLLFVKEHVKDIEAFRREGKIIAEKPFDRFSKSIEVDWSDGKDIYTFMRGAPESIFDLLSKDVVQKAEKTYTKFAKEGLRVIAFAYKEKGKKNFTFLGFVGIYDPPRVEAKKTLEQARDAGIRVVMVTGDNPQTALAISEEVGLMEQDELVITADEIVDVSDEELMRKLPHIRVFARMKPEDKKRLVMLYRRAGYIVAVTGDGVNDALALSEAHIGIAMGEQGTDVAKDASDIVITDDNLATIIKAIEEGRVIFDNIVKTVIFLIASNIVEFSILALAIVANLPLPFTPTQILWINLISDGIPALALAADLKRHNVLLKKPRDVRESILSIKRLFFIARLAIPVSLLFLALYYILLQNVPHKIASFSLFNILMVGVFVLLFVVRGSIFPMSKFLLYSVGISLLLQLLIILNPFLRQILS